MSQPADSATTPSATLDVARSRANTGASLSAAPYGTSYRSTTGSSVVSNGSLLDLYARSPASFPESLDTPAHMGNAFSAAGNASTPTQPSATPSSSAAIPMTPTARGFHTPSNDQGSADAGFFVPPSDSNASVWTTASAPPTEMLMQSKRASMAGFDIDAMRSVQPAHDHNASESTADALPLPPRIGVEAPQDDSDGSHYDDDEMPGAFSHDSFDHSADRTIEPLTNRNGAADANHGFTDEIFSNALPSPPVPRRTSSVMQDSFNISPSPSQTEDLVRSEPHVTKHAASRSSSGQLASDQIPQRRSSADFRDDPVRRHASREPSLPSQETSPSRSTANATDVASGSTSRFPVSPTKGTSLRAVDENARPSNDAGSRSSHEPTLDEQMRLEQEMLAEADGSRPRTLKEARERAKLRRQQSETVSPPSTSANPLPAAATTTTSPRKGASLHTRDVASSATAAALEDGASRSSIDSRDRPLRNPKRISNRDSTLAADRQSLSERSAPSDYSHDSGADGAFTYDEPAAQHLLESEGIVDQQTASMTDLAHAVDSAMNDLSFGDADETLSADDEFATPLPPTKSQEDSRPRLPTSLPSAQSLASITGSNQFTSQDVARSSPLPSPARRSAQTPKANFLPTFTPAHSIATPPLGSPVTQRSAQAVATPQQAGPSLPARIDVYGKTLPMPKAFASSGIIIDKKRLSSWERARTYAQYTNELLHLQTGLSLWMEAVQRPAMRQQNNRTNQNKQADEWMAQGTLPRSTHVRNEGSYADSIRSDMTFPMRGDGAKAKEIVSIMPTMTESPVRSPVNLPYPGVVSQQQPRSNSTQSFSSISSPALPLSNSANDSLAGTGGVSRSSGMGGGNRFFSGLGRKGSKRTAPSAPVSSNPASSPLSSIAVAVGGSRAYLANNRNKRTSSPGLSGAVPSASLSSARPSTDTFETSFSSHSQPESPATGAVRVTGLGLGASSGDTPSLGPLASASAGRLNTVREARNTPSALNTPTSAAVTSTSGTTGLRAPLGPRAPGDMKRTGSTQSQTTPITPVTPITPITPITGGFGSGPTFVSRLGGGSFSSSGGAHTPRSPGRDGYSSPEFLHAPRRTSDLTGTSPSSPPFSAQDASPRLGTGLRSSLSYGSVRDRMRRGSSPGPMEDEAFTEALTKLGDILPDADTQTLRYYLKKAKGNDLTAIGDYLQDQSLGKLPKFA